MTTEYVGLKAERLNGVKLRVAEHNERSPETTVPKYIDRILEDAGIKLLTDQELKQRLSHLEVPAK